MSTADLTTSFQNYFNVNKFDTDDLKRAVSDEKSLLTPKDVTDLFNNLAPPESVTVTITPPATDSVNPTDGLEQTFFIEPGTIVRKDQSTLTNPYLKDRISMASIQSDDFIPARADLNKLVESGSERIIDLRSIGELTGIGDQDISDTFFKSRAEIGDIRGNKILTESGEVAGYLYKHSKPLTIQSSTELNLSLTTSENTDISISVNVVDSHNRHFTTNRNDQHIGLSRDLEFSFTASDPLTQEERDNVSAVFDRLTPMLNNFHEEYSVLQNDMTQLTHFLENQNIFQSSSFELSTLDGAQSLSYTSSSDKEPKLKTRQIEANYFQHESRVIAASTAIELCSDAEHYLAKHQALVNQPEHSWQRDVISDLLDHLPENGRKVLASMLT